MPSELSAISKFQIELSSFRRVNRLPWLIGEPQQNERPPYPHDHTYGSGPVSNVHWLRPCLRCIYHASLRIEFATGEPSYFLFSSLLFSACLGATPLRLLERIISQRCRYAHPASHLMLKPVSSMGNGLGSQGSAVLPAVATEGLMTMFNDDVQ